MLGHLRSKGEGSDVEVQTTVSTGHAASDGGGIGGHDDSSRRSGGGRGGGREW